jgi:hypothetical protein
VEAEGARQGGEREIELPEAMDWGGLIEQAITAAVDEIEFFKLKKGKSNGPIKT